MHVDTSIIILVKDNLKYTRECIESIEKFTNYRKTSFEVIVVDNGSTQETKDYLNQCREKFRELSIITNKINAGFPVGNNQAAKVARGKYLLLLNNDTVVTDGWLERLVNEIKTDDKIAAVGPYTSRAGSDQMIHGLPQVKTQEDIHKVCSTIYRSGNLKEKDAADLLIFFCVLIRKSVWDEIGGLDEDFTPGNYEDNLFCFHVRRLGYKMRVANCFIWHFGSRSWYGGEETAQDKEALAKYCSIIARNQKIFAKKVGFDNRISLCMIVADNEPPEYLERCLKSACEWVDEINIVFNYKHFPKPWRLKKLIDVSAKYQKEINGKLPWKDFGCKYERWSKGKFSDMRNKSLDMATMPYILILDADDVLKTPQGVKEILFLNQNVDCIKCQIESPKGYGRKGKITTEIIEQRRLFKNNKDFRYRNLVHEDVGYTMMEKGENCISTNITIRHMGYIDPKRAKQHNERNMNLLELELKDKPHSLTYFHMVNSLLVKGGKKNLIRAINLIDECIKKFELKDSDQITPKMRVLRGLACKHIGAVDASQSDFLTAWLKFKHPEAAVNLSDSYWSQKKYDAAIAVLDEMFSMKEFSVGGLPIDFHELKMHGYHNMAVCLIESIKTCKPEEKPELMKKCEYYLSRYVQLDPNNLLIADKLVSLYKHSGRVNLAVAGTLDLVNRFPAYGLGWAFLGEVELMNKQYSTAQAYFNAALQVSPFNKQLKHNIKMLQMAMKAKDCANA